MYRTIVRRRIRSLYKEANRGNWQAIVDTLHTKFAYRFVGDTPLGGTRTSKRAMQAWFQRVYRLVPDAQFEPQTIVVEGMPWDTRIMTYVKIRGMMPSGSERTTTPYENEFMQLMQLKWGSVTSVITLEDTQKFAAVLPTLAAAGIADATAVPITD
jgi:ketosteroid isomerase-like protein